MIRGQVSVEGLGDLRRAIRQIDKANGKAEGLPAFRDHLREAAQIVVDEAKSRAPRGSKPIPRGRSPRARLVDNIRPRVKGDTALVAALGKQKSPAWPGGYRYPRRLEYEGSGGNRSGAGRRAFLLPALQAKTDEVARHMEGVLDAIERAWGD